jgi:hypothetical protein
MSLPADLADSLDPGRLELKEDSLLLAGVVLLAIGGLDARWIC